jgi:hypothetical protein
VDIVVLCSVTECDVEAGYMQVFTWRTWILLLLLNHTYSLDVGNYVNITRNVLHMCSWRGT